MIRVIKKFKELLDVKDNWASSAGKFWRTNAEGTGLEAVDLGAGGNGASAYEIAVTNGFVGDEAAWLLSLEGADSNVPGPTGVGIASITGPVSAGLIDTYTVTFTDTSVTTFSVTNGQDGADSNVPGPVGVGIASISGPVTLGLVDTYTIAYTDASTSTFTVTNGANGLTTTVNGVVQVNGEINLTAADLNAEGVGVAAQLITALNLGSASQASVDDFLPSTTEIPTQYTDAMAEAALADEMALKVNTASIDNLSNKRQHIAHGFISTPAAPTFVGNVYTRPGSTPYSVAIDGVVSNVSTDAIIDIGATAEWLGYTQAQRYGQWFICKIGDLSITASKTPFNILSLDSIPVDTVYCNDNGAGGYEWIPAREHHQASRNLIVHDEDHHAYGAKYISGFTSFVGLDNNTFTMAGGEISDEGLRSVISGTQTTCRIGYRSGSALKFDTASTGYAKLNAGVPQYDNAGTLTNLGANKYGVAWVFATNRYTDAVVIITGQGEYTTVALAQAAASPTLTGLSVAEWKLCYRVIVQNFAGALKYIQADPLYNESNGPAINAGAPSTVTAGNVTVNTVGYTDPSIVNAQLLADKVDGMQSGGGFKASLLPGSFRLTGAATEPLHSGGKLQYIATGSELVAYAQIPSGTTEGYANGNLTVDIDFTLTGATLTNTHTIIFGVGIIELNENNLDSTAPPLTGNGYAEATYTLGASEVTLSNHKITLTIAAHTSISAARPWKLLLTRRINTDTSVAMAEFTGMTVYE